MSDLVGNPKDGFSHNEAQMVNSADLDQTLGLQCLLWPIRPKPLH